MILGRELVEEDIFESLASPMLLRASSAAPPASPICVTRAENGSDLQAFKPRRRLPLFLMVTWSPFRAGPRSRNLEHFLGLGDGGRRRHFLRTKF